MANQLTTTTPVLSIVDGHPTTTTRAIAEHFKKRHDTVLRALQNLQCSQEFSDRNFAAAEYLDEQGKPRTEYQVTRDGFAFLCMGFTGAEAAKWKEAYIYAFNKMEREVLVKAQSALPPPLVSPEQKANIKEAVLRKAERLGIHYQAVWRNFYSTFKVHSYHALPASQYEAAIAWLGGEPTPQQQLPNGEPVQLACGPIGEHSALGVITKINGSYHRGKPENGFGTVEVDFGEVKKSYKVNHLIWKELTVGQPVRFEFAEAPITSQIRKVEPMPLFIPHNSSRFQIAMGSVH